MIGGNAAVAKEVANGDAMTRHPQRLKPIAGPRRPNHEREGNAVEVNGLVVSR